MLKFLNIFKSVKNAPESKELTDFLANNEAFKEAAMKVHKMALNATNSIDHTQLENNELKANSGPVILAANKGYTGKLYQITGILQFQDLFMNQKALILHFHSKNKQSEQLGGLLHQSIQHSNGWSIIKINIDDPDNFELKHEFQIEDAPETFLYIDGEEKKSDYYSMRLKVADLSIHKIDVDYVDCIKIYDEVAERYLQNSLTAPSAKKLFFAAVLMYLANDDSVGAGMALEKYTDQLPSFGGSRQEKFLAAIIKAIEENNTEEFSLQCYEHNKIIPLDKWQTTILGRIKDKISPQQQQELQQGDDGQQQHVEDVPTGGVNVF